MLNIVLTGKMRMQETPAAAGERFAYTTAGCGICLILNTFVNTWTASGNGWR